jgi:hypothetical protein
LEEEADKDPMKGLLEIYHEFAKVFGEEEFKVLPPHRPYDLAVDLKEGAKLHHGVTVRVRNEYLISVCAPSLMCTHVCTAGLL